MTAFVTLNGTSKECGLEAANIHSMPDLDKYDFSISKMQEAFYKDPFCQKECLMTLTSPSAKDPEYVKNYPDTCDVLLLTEAKYEWFNEMEMGPWNRRKSTEYEELKKKFETMFLERMYKYYPLTKGKVKQIVIGSPKW